MSLGMAHHANPGIRFSRPVALIAEAVGSLQFKATALVVVLTISVTTAVAMYLFRSGGELVHQRRAEEVISSAGLLAKAASPLLADGDLTAIRRLAKDAADGRPLLYVIVMDTNWGQIASAQHQGGGALDGPPQNAAERAPVPGLPALWARASGDAVFMDVTYPVTARAVANATGAAQRELLGYVRTGMICDDWQRTMASRLDLLVGVGLLSMVAAIPFGFLLVRRIVGPLDGLADAMIGFSNGRLDVRSGVRRRDEIGRLASAFNQMADQYQQTHLRMMRLNAELEERVAYRTQQLRELASRDPLTGLYNRRHFSEVIDRCFAEAVRYGTDLSCVMIDLDDFKMANDAFGHQIGDELLQLAGGTIVSQLRTADVAARYGGDEFILLLPQTDADRAHVLGERIIARFNSELSDRLPDAAVRMSVGIASLRTVNAKNGEDLIRAADNALYDAKAMGKNRIVSAVPAA